MRHPDLQEVISLSGASMTILSTPMMVASREITRHRFSIDFTAVIYPDANSRP